MGSTNRSNLEEYLRPTLEKEGLKSYTINVSGNSEVGDGYLGEITFVTVTGKSETNEKKVYNFVVKCGKRSKEFRDIMPIKSAFENEINYYNKILPTFEQFQAEKRIKEPFNNFAKCYGTLISEDIEMLVLDNLKSRGYFLHDRKHPMNKEHIKTVLQTYGKLHAISFALRDQKPDVFKELAGHLVDFFKLLKPTATSADEVNIFQFIIDLAKEKNETEIAEKASLINQKSRSVHDLTDPTDPFAVILHGDCWNNNFMFQYEGDQNDKPSNVALLDFQLSRLASPVYDLSYFLFTTLSEEDMGNFDEFNNLYYESFSDFLRKLGSDPDKMFPFEELMNQWKKFSLFGLVLLPGIVKICLSDTDEVPDLVGAAESGIDMADIFNSGVRNMEEYGKRTLPIIKLAIEKGFV